MLILILSSSVLVLAQDACQDFVDKNPDLADTDIIIKTGQLRFLSSSPLKIDWTRIITPAGATACFDKLTFFCGGFRNVSQVEKYLYKSVVRRPTTGDTSPIEIGAECFCQDKPRLFITAELSPTLKTSNQTINVHVDFLNNITCSDVGKWECDKVRKKTKTTDLKLIWDLNVKTYYLTDGINTEDTIHVMNLTNIFNIPGFQVCFDQLFFYYNGRENSTNTTNYEREMKMWPQQNHDTFPAVFEDACQEKPWLMIDGRMGPVDFRTTLKMTDLNNDLPECSRDEPVGTPPPIDDGNTTMTPPPTVPFTTSTQRRPEVTETTTSATTIPAPQRKVKKEDNSSFVILLSLAIIVLVIVLLVLLCVCWKLKKDYDPLPAPVSPVKPPIVRDVPSKESEEKPAEDGSMAPRPRKELTFDRENNKWSFR